MRAAVCVLLLLAVAVAGVPNGYRPQGGVFPSYYKPPVVEHLIGNRIVESSEEEDNKNDPNYVPDYSEDYDVSEEYNDATYEYSEEAPYSVEEPEEAKLWLSDEDPDWSPPYDSEETLETQSQETQSQESQEAGVGPILQQIAEILSTGGSFLPEEIGGQGTQSADQEELKETLQGMNLTEEDARLVLHNLLQLRDDNHNKQATPGPAYRPFPPVGVYKRSLRYRQQPQQEWQEPAAYNTGVKQLQRDETVIDSGNQGWVGAGVEPIEGPQDHGIGAGVEPASGGGWFDFDSSSQSEEDGPSFTGWLQQGWRRVSDAAEDLGDRAEGTFRRLGHNIAGAAHSVHDAARTAYDRVREGVPEVVARLKALIVKFGIVIQEGARYCLRRLTHAYDTQVRGAEVMVKLEQKLEEGHAEVARFFQLLGDKIAAWKEQHPAEGVDTGLVVEHHHQGAGQSQDQQEGQQRQDAEGAMPDFFQTQDVQQQLNKLVEVGVLTNEDLEFINQVQQNEQQSQQNQDYQQQNQDYQQQNQAYQQQNQDYQQQNQAYQQQNQDYQQQNQDYQQQNQNYQQQNQNYQQQNQNYQQQNQDYQQQNQNDQQQNEPLPHWAYIR